jgi:hypothetical protein
MFVEQQQVVLPFYRDGKRGGKLKPENRRHPSQLLFVTWGRSSSRVVYCDVEGAKEVKAVIIYCVKDVRSHVEPIE